MADETETLAVFIDDFICAAAILTGKPPVSDSDAGFLNVNQITERSGSIHVFSSQIRLASEQDFDLGVIYPLGEDTDQLAMLSSRIDDLPGSSAQRLKHFGLYEALDRASCPKTLSAYLGVLVKGSLDLANRGQFVDELVVAIPYWDEQVSKPSEKVAQLKEFLEAAVERVASVLKFKRCALAQVHNAAWRFDQEGSAWRNLFARSSFFLWRSGFSFTYWVDTKTGKKVSYSDYPAEHDPPNPHHWRSLAIAEALEELKDKREGKDPDQNRFSIVRMPGEKPPSPGCETKSNSLVPPSESLVNELLRDGRATFQRHAVLGGLVCAKDISSSVDRFCKPFSGETGDTSNIPEGEQVDGLTSIFTWLASAKGGENQHAALTGKKVIRDDPEDNGLGYRPLIRGEVDELDSLKTNESNQTPATVLGENDPTTIDKGKVSQDSSDHLLIKLHSSEELESPADETLGILLKQYDSGLARKVIVPLDLFDNDDRYLMEFQRQASGQLTLLVRAGLRAVPLDAPDEPLLLRANGDRSYDIDFDEAQRDEIRHWNSLSTLVHKGIIKAWAVQDPKNGD